MLALTGPTSALSGENSICHGTTSDGALINGVQLPVSGPNFQTYSQDAALRERVFVHGRVLDVLLRSFESLHQTMPDKRFKYAETGLRNGGPFPPHKTHQNGLSVDIMVPVIDGTGNSILFPTEESNRYGYDIEFDSSGHAPDFHIDFDALAALIIAIEEQARSQGFDIWRIFFAPDLQDELMNTTGGKQIPESIRFNKTQSWVRHDEHIHVDFNIPCEPKSSSD